jgi:hypothetical protein
MNRGIGRIATTAAAALALFALAAAPAAAQKRGGTIVFAQEAPPPTLDPYFDLRVDAQRRDEHLRALRRATEQRPDQGTGRHGQPRRYLPSRCAAASSSTTARR